MAEYWKSTPRLWCKHCKTFYRDTAFDTQQHNNTGKHQSAVQRSIRNLHKDTEREERNAQRAKDEVARLNGIVSGKRTNLPTKDGVRKPVNAGQASEGERKRQIAQLAAMGVAIPAEFRREMAMVGERNTISERRVEARKTEDEEHVKGEPEEYERSVGVRKRRREDDEETEEREARPTTGARDMRWGSRRKTLAEEETDVDIGSLIGKSEDGHPAADEQKLVKTEEIANAESQEADTVAPKPTIPDSSAEPPAKQEEMSVPPPVMFRKRKNKIKVGG